MNNVIYFPKLYPYGPILRDERDRLIKLFIGKSKDDMRYLWNNVGDDSFINGYDIADIHSYMNMLGDGDYCAV